MKSTLAIKAQIHYSLAYLVVGFIITFMLCFCNQTAFSQTIIETENSDSSDTEIEVPKERKFYTFTLDHIHPDTIIGSPFDTSLSNFFNYNFNLFNFQNNLGNAGTPQQSLLAKDSIFTGLNFRFDNLYGYRLGIHKMRFKELTQPYASVTYLNGAQQEEGINIELSQNIRENWNVSAWYRKLSSVGFYVKQKSAINNFYFNQHFKTKNNRYQLMLYGVYNETNNQENGGIKYDSLLTDATQQIARQGFQMNFTNAQNRSRQQEYLLKQRFNFGPKSKFYYVDENDSLYPDSIILERVQPRVTLEHSFVFQHQEFVFEDKGTDSSNYININIPNGDTIFEKTLLNKFDNEFAVILQPWLRQDSSFFGSLRLKAGAGFEYGTYSQYNYNIPRTDEFLNNMYLKASLYNLQHNALNLNVGGKLILSGYNEGDFSIGGHISNRFSENIRIIFIANSSSQRPALIFNQYNSAGWSWKNSFKKMGILQCDLSLNMDKSFFKLGAFYQTIANYTYFGINGAPQQFKGTITTIRPYVEKLFNVSVFHLRLTGGYQFIDQVGIINLPELFTYNSLYFESKIFKSEMLVRLGTDFFYTSDYTADNFNPITRQFEVQTNQKVGSYPWLEPFVMVNVENFYFFARFANAAEGFFGYNYLARPGYAMQDRALKFSIRWDFIN